METIVSIPTEHNWYVVFLAFCQSIVIYSVPYTLLVFATITKEGDLLTEFVVGGLYLGLTKILAPLSCCLVNWYSFKVLNILAPSISLISMISSHFITASEINYLLVLFFSVFGGFGCSMFEVSAELMPTYWFCNRRGLAQTLAQSGHTVGYLLVPTVLLYLFFQSTFKKMHNIFFFFAGLYLPLIILGILTPEEKTIDVTFDSFDDEPPKKKVKTKRVTFWDEEFAKSIAVADGHELLARRLSYSIFKTHHNLIFPRVKDIIGPNSITLHVPDSSVQKVLSKPWLHGFRRWSISSTDQLPVPVNISGRQNITIVVKPDLRSVSRPMYRTDIFFSWNIFSLPVYYSQDNQLDYHLAVTRAISFKDYQQEIDDSLFKYYVPEAMIRTLLTMLDCNIYHDYYIAILFVSCLLAAYSQQLPLIFIFRRAIELGAGDEAFSLVIGLGIGRTLGRACVMLEGACSSGSDYYVFLTILITAAGAVTVAVTFVGNVMIVMFMYMVFYGAIYDMTHTLRFSLVYQIAKLNDLTNTCGHLFLWQGTGVIISAAISGYLFMKYGKTDYIFHMSGCGLIVSGILLKIVRIVQKRTLMNTFISSQ